MADSSTDGEYDKLLLLLRTMESSCYCPAGFADREDSDGNVTIWYMARRPSTVWNVLAGLVATTMLLLQLQFKNNSRPTSVHPRENFHGSIIMYAVLVINIALHNCSTSSISQLYHITLYHNCIISHCEQRVIII